MPTTWQCARACTFILLGHRAASHTAKLPDDGAKTAYEAKPDMIGELVKSMTDGAC
jgi:hypothetical protein